MWWFACIFEILRNLWLIGKYLVVSMCPPVFRTIFYLSMFLSQMCVGMINQTMLSFLLFFSTFQVCEFLQSSSSQSSTFNVNSVCQLWLITWNYPTAICLTSLVNYIPWIIFLFLTRTHAVVIELLR